MEEFLSLHKHWCTADSIDHKMRCTEKWAKIRGEFASPLTNLGWKHSMMMSLTVYYSLLYVVIEGYKTLKLADAEIDKHLQNEDFVDRLRRFRNATFHYQKDPFSEKLLDFLDPEDSSDWILSLNTAFKKFFEKHLPIHETAEKMGEGQKA